MKDVLIQSQNLQPTDPVYQFAHSAALVFAVVGIALLLFILIFLKNPLSRLSIKILMGIGIIGIPLVTVSLGFMLGLDKAKKIEFCGSCHRAMKAYLVDMQDTDSSTLAAEHFKNLWINHNQCYECHTDYGLLGDFKAKAKGFVDVFRYYFGLWDGTVDSDVQFKNENCLKCHALVSTYTKQEIHQENEKDINDNLVFCADCHSPVHRH